MLCKPNKHSCKSGRVHAPTACAIYPGSNFWIYQTGIFAVHQFSRSVVSDSLLPHESQHARPPCISPTPGVHSDSRPLSRLCHPAISSSVVPFSSCPQSLPASESFPMSQLFAWGDQSTGVSALASFFPRKSQGWSPSEWTGWISLQSKGLSRVFSNIIPPLLFLPWAFACILCLSGILSPHCFTIQSFNPVWASLLQWFYHSPEPQIGSYFNYTS